MTACRRACSGIFRPVSIAIATKPRVCFFFDKRSGIVQCSFMVSKYALNSHLMFFTYVQATICIASLVICCLMVLVNGDVPATCRLLQFVFAHLTNKVRLLRIYQTFCSFIKSRDPTDYLIKNEVFTSIWLTARSWALANASNNLKACRTLELCA